MIFLLNYSYSQQVDLINENFDDGLPANWIHCSGNWGNAPLWEVTSETLRESSGPYFASVLNAIQLPSVDLTLITDPFLEFKLAMAVIDTNIQLSVWYTTEGTCNPVWDFEAGGYIFNNWDLLSTYDPETIAASDSWTPLNTDYQTISIDLSQHKDSTDIRFCLTAHYINSFARGVWYLDNIKIYGGLQTGVFELSQSSSFKLFPNPANKIVYFMPDQHINNATLKITDITGSVLLDKSTNLTMEEIDVSSYNSGIYLVHYIVSGQNAAIKKLIVH